MRRMWMLLLVVTLMVIVLAVPAMAVEQVDGEWVESITCECALAGKNKTHVTGCPEETVVWQPWTNTTSLPTSGNYYLTGNVTVTAIAGVTSTSVVRLDLNGFDVTVNSSKNIRFYALRTGSVGLHITDSSAGDEDGVGTGEMINDSNYTQGGFVWTQNTNNQTIKIYAGTFDGTSYTMSSPSANFGSLFCLVGGSFYMYGGEIKGCTLSESEVAAHVRNNGTAAYYPTGAAVHLGAVTFEMNGGVIRGGYTQANVKSDNSKIAAKGSAVYVGTAKIDNISYPSSFTMNGGTIYGGYAKCIDKDNKGHAGSIYVESSCTLTIKDGATVSGGKADYNGGSINVAGTLNIEGGLITGGESVNDQGGNIWVSGTMTITGGTISGGTANNGGNIGMSSAATTNRITGATITGGIARSDGGNIAVNSTGSVGTLTIGEGTEISSGTAGDTGRNVYISNNTAGGSTSWATTVIIEDGAQITKGTSASTCTDVYVKTDTHKTSGVQGEVYFTVNGTQTGTRLGTVAMTDSVTFTCNGTPVNYYEVVYNTLANAVANATAANGDYVTLLADSSEALTVSADLNLDLNGHTVALDPASDDVKIKLFDSTAIGHNVPTGSATVTGGTVVSTFLTGELSNYSKNYRFVTVADGSTYTAHHVYLVIKSTVLYPGVDPYYGYRTVLRCDDTIAGLLNADGGEYGILLNNVATDYDKTATAYGADKVENSIRVKLSNLLSGATPEADSKVTVSARAYLKINGVTIEGTASTPHSLKSMVEAIVAMDQSTIGATAKTNLGIMYDTYSSFMANWTGVAEVLDGYHTAE